MVSLPAGHMAPVVKGPEQRRGLRKGLKCLFSECKWSEQLALALLVSLSLSFLLFLLFYLAVHVSLSTSSVLLPYGDLLNLFHIICVTDTATIVRFGFESLEISHKSLEIK